MVREDVDDTGAAWRGLRSSISSIKALVVDWFQISTSRDFLASRMSRRQLWPWIIPPFAITAVVLDIASCISSSGGFPVIFVLEELPFLFLSLWMSRWKPTTVKVDVAFASWIACTIVSSASNGFLKKRIGYAWPPVAMLMLQAYGIHSLAVLSVAVVSVICLAMTTDTLNSSEGVYSLVVSTASVAIVEYTVASSFDRLKESIDEKQILLDLATDGWGSLDSTTHVLSIVSSKLAETLGREDLVGIPLEAVVEARDHGALQELIGSAGAGKGVGGDNSNRHVLLTFNSAGLQFDARLIVHHVSRSRASQVNFSVTLVGEVRHPSASSVLGSKGMARMTSAPVATERAKSERSVSTRTITAGQQSDVDDNESMWSVVEEGENLLTGIAFRSVCVQTPPRTRRRKGPQPAGSLCSDWFQRERLRTWQHRDGSAGQQALGALSVSKREASLRLPAFEPTPLSSRWLVLRRLVRSVNTGLPVECCTSHASWASLTEVLNHFSTLPCSGLDPPFTDWQCPSCFAMNPWDAGLQVQSDEEAATTLQLCSICLKVVVPLSGRTV
mmetsp:Transcript_26152/g.60995  ORF Transcript_26152/g.60995 Transcript_26152/m.60995 type:complete len:558 (-) Transcript_26152:57-1730(-)